MKNLFMVLAFLLCNLLVYSQQMVNVSIINASKNGGKIFLSIFNSEQTYNKRQVFQVFSVDPLIDSTQFCIEIPVGEYVFSIYQDSNDNGKLDCNLLGIPKERFGFSNYCGKSVPGDFQKLKVLIKKRSTDLHLCLVKI